MSIVDKVKQMLGQHSDKAKQGMEKAGDMFDQKTGGKHSDKVDRMQEKTGNFIDRESERPGDTGQNHGQGREPGQGGRPQP